MKKHIAPQFPLPLRLPANEKARAMRAKLQALVDQGVNGEKIAAQAKLDRLLKRFDFEAPDLTETVDLFSGVFEPCHNGMAAHVWTFPEGEFEIANSVKWAIEHAAGIACSFRGASLMAEATPATITKLSAIALHIAESFRALWRQFAPVSPQDRAVFLQGLYEGMMNENRALGQPLPSRACVVKVRKPKKRAVTMAPGMNLHPYSVAVPLGRQVRFLVPLQQIKADLENAVNKQLTA